MWIYKSPIGLMQIYLNSSGRYSLQIRDTVYGFYSSPAAAADDVCTFTTGCNDWDFLFLSANPPIDLSEWQRLSHLP